MPALLTPARRRGMELLDQPGLDPALQRRSLADVVRANTLFGGTRAVLRALAPTLAAARGPLTLLDVGTGLGDIPACAREAAARRGVTLVTYGLDMAAALVVASRERVDGVVCGDALALPFADRSIDVVTCSQTLHHFDDASACAVVRELDRVARRCVIVSDLRRSWVAAAGIWLASFPLGFHPISRHDGVVSVLRGFTPRELAALVCASVGTRASVQRHLGWRVTASWRREST